MFTESDAGDSNQGEGVSMTSARETEPDEPEEITTQTEAAPASVPFSDSGSESAGLPFVEAQSVVEKLEISTPEQAVEDAMPTYNELPEPEWSQTECHMNVRSVRCAMNPRLAYRGLPIVLGIQVGSSVCVSRSLIACINIHTRCCIQVMECRASSNVCARSRKCCPA